MSLESCAIFVPFLVLFPLLLAKKTTPFAGSLVGVSVGLVLVSLMGALHISDLSMVADQGVKLLIQVVSILIGAFYFVSCSEDSGILKGLMDWISKILTHRGQRLFLIGFALSLVFEGAGGFGTPLFLVMPLLMEGGVPPLIAAVTPLMAASVGVPFGALGVPVMVGFSGANPEIVAQNVAPWMALIALPAGVLVARNLSGGSLLNRTMLPWVGLVITAFSGGLLLGVRFSPNIPTLLGGILALSVGLATAHRHKVPITKMAKTGAWIYGGLLGTLLLTRAFHLPFPPFFVFFFFGSLAVLVQKKPLPLRRTLVRCSRTIGVVCSWILWISVVKHLGFITTLGNSLPVLLTKEFSTITGFFGSLLFGSATFSNLLAAPITNSKFHDLVAFGASLGTTLTLQSAMVLQSLAPQELRYADIAKKLVPLFIAGLVIWCLALLLRVPGLGLTP